jgi:hypothetical protein
MATISLLLLTAALPVLLHDYESGGDTRLNYETSINDVGNSANKDTVSTMIVENRVPDLTANPELTTSAIEPVHVPHKIVNSRPTEIKDDSTTFQENITMSGPNALTTGKSMATLTVIPTAPFGSAVDLTDEVPEMKNPPHLNEIDSTGLPAIVEDPIHVSIVYSTEESVSHDNPPIIYSMTTLEKKVIVVTSKMNSTKDLEGDIIQKSEKTESDQFIVSASILPSPVEISSTVSPSVIKAPYPNVAVFHESKRPTRPALTAEKVSTQYSYDFFAENVNYVTGVEFCRQISRGSRLLSIESSHEKRIVDAYVKSRQFEIFGYKEDYLRYIWTGGYFDLDSNQPYTLRWVDHPTPMKAFEYQQFCPESKNIHKIIDQALSGLKSITLGLTNLNPCNRHWAHVIIDFTGHRINQSCWQILTSDVLSPDDFRLPFVCQR